MKFEIQVQADIPPMFLDALMLAAREAVRARISHTMQRHKTVEDGDDDRRLRIITEEIGEVARSIEDIEQAIDLKTRESNHVDMTTLEELRRDVIKRKAHLREELAQVAATALRWLAAEIAADQARDATDNTKQEQAHG